MAIRFDAKDLLQALDEAPKKSEVAVKMLATEGAKKFENYAKQNRPWTDRTGHARQTLKGWVDVFSDKVRINIGHGVYYGIYLELCNERRYAVLQRTINAVSPEIVRGFDKLLNYLR